MSAIVEIGVVPELSDDQATKILGVAFAANYYERDDGQLPADSGRRQEDAQELVRQCRLAVLAGNDQKAVLDILFIAEVDLGSIPSLSSEGELTNMSATEQQEDLTQYTVLMLGNILEALGNHLEAASTDEQADEINHNIDVVKDEILRRANGGDQSAETLAQTFTEVEAPAPAASAAAVASAATTVDRTALENQITFPMMRANGIDPSEIPGLSDGELQWLIDHPNGTATSSSDPTARGVSEADSSTQMPAPRGDTVETTRMVAVPQEQLPPDTTDGPTPTPAKAGSSGVSDERIKLEEQVTGPMLKVYGVGRNDVASGKIGDNELRFMIEHPDGQVTLEALEVVRALDHEVAAAGESQSRSQTVQETVAPAATPTIAEQLRAAKTNATDVANAEPSTGNGFSPPAQSEPEKPKRGRRPAAQQAAQESQETEPIAAAQPATVTGTSSSVASADDPENPIQADLDRENMLVPAEIEERVQLPFDLTKHSETEIRSFHSKFHALHSRALYKLTLWEQELKDETKLRKKREIDVLNAIPVTPKLTDAQRDARVAADPEVVAHRDQEHELDKKVRQWRLMAENFGRDVAVCSRQLGRSDEEASGAR